MVRKIKFRGKDIDTGEWRYGYLSFFYTAGRDKNGFILTDKARIYSQEDVRCYDVLAETVGQFTGLFDKNYAVASKSKVANEGAFIFEIIQDQIYNHCHSFGANNRIDLYNGEISWQTKDSYNGNTIKASNGKDSDHLFIGRLRDTTKGFVLQGVIYYFALYNKSLTPEEVEEEKVKLENYWEGGKNELA